MKKTTIFALIMVMGLLSSCSDIVIHRESIHFKFVDDKYVSVLKSIDLDPSIPDGIGKYKGFTLIFGGNLEECDSCTLEKGEMTVFNYLIVMDSEKGDIFLITKYSEYYEPNHRFVHRNKIDVINLLKKGNKAAPTLKRNSSESDVDFAHRIIDGIVLK